MIQAYERVGDRLYLDLKASIENGELSHGERIEPFRKLAERYDISSSKAQRVIKRLSEEGYLTRRHGSGCFVNQAPAPTAKPTLSLPSTDPADTAMAIIVPSYTYQQYLSPGISDGNGSHDILRGIEEITGFASERCQFYSETQSDLIPLLEAQQAQTILVLADVHADVTAYLRNVYEQGTQVIYIGCHHFEQYPSGLTVKPDERQAMIYLLDHLYQQGHRQIAFLTWNCLRRKRYIWLEKRHRAYQAYMYSHNLTPITYSFTTDFGKLHADMEHQQQELPEMFETLTDVTAFCCVNDSLAMRLLLYCQKHQIHMPQSFALTGFDDLPDTIRVGLTTINQQHYLQGQLVGRLVQQFQQTGMTVSGNLFTQPKLMVRRSTSLTNPEPRKKK